MLLSAIVPNYNHGAVVGDAIARLAAQRPEPDEIIVVDDGSTDGSLEILAQLQVKFPNLRIIALEQNVGAIGALNRGLKEARGKYVYFGAADDVTLPGLFAALVPLMDQNPCIAFASAEGIVEDLATGRLGFRPPIRPAHNPIILTPADVQNVFRKMDNWILTGAALLRREMLLEAGGFDASLGAFADGYAVRQLAFAHGGAFAPHMGLVWRISASGLSRSQASDPDSNLQVRDIAIRRLTEDPAVPDWYPALFDRRWRFGIGRLAIESRPMNGDMLRRVAARGIFGRFILELSVRVGGGLGRLTALAWLLMRERPLDLPALAATHWKRRKIILGDIMRTLDPAGKPDSG